METIGNPKHRGYHQYFDMSLEKVFEMICALQKDSGALGFLSGS